MADDFDPYHRWLGVPPGERPPNHYALLGLNLFEDDAESISNAADRQMAHVRTFQTGQHSTLSQTLLNELASARVCLLNARQKTAYDAELKSKRTTAIRPAPIAPPIARPPAPRPVPLPDAVQPAQAFPEAFPSPPPPGAGRLASRSKRDRPAAHAASWRAPAAVGFVAGLALASIGWFIAERGAPIAEWESGTDPSVSGELGTDRAGRKQSASKAKREPSLFTAIDPPSPLGIEAEKLVLWNHHNGRHNDRGTEKCNVRLYLGGHEIWSKKDVEVPWVPNEDRNASLALPKERFDRVRVEITKWYRTSGGLTEIEVLSGSRNLALGCPARATSEWSARFEAGRATDGVTESLPDSGFLLPDGAPGWIEVDLSLPRPRDVPGITADKVVIWNQHNGPINNSGSRSCDMTLYAGKRAIWQKEGVQLPWAPNQDLSVELKLPEVKFDRLRIAVTPREGQWGGLAEVQVMRGGENVALGCPTFDSGNFDDRRGGGRVTDGIASSAVDTIGYWLLPHQGPGWVEIDLACLDPHLGAANRRLGAHLALVEGDWQRGLAWMARGDDEQLRMLAHADLDTVRDSAERLALGDAWWEFSAQARGKIKERLLARSIWRYRQVLSRVQEAQRRRIAARIDEVLPQLPERNHLFFMPELETVPWNWDFRELKIAANGAPSRYGLWMHATPNGSSHAAFSLGKRYVRFRGAAGINDSACGRTATALTFRIVADGRELWKSQPLKATGSSEPFNVSLAGVDKLELFVDCPGPNHWGHGVWLEPRLEE